MAEPAKLARHRDRDEYVRRLLGLLDDLSPDRILTHAMPDAVWTHLQDSLRIEGGSPSRVRPAAVRGWLGTLAAAAVCVLFAGSLLGSQDRAGSGAITQLSIPSETQVSAADSRQAPPSMTTPVRAQPSTQGDVDVIPVQRVLASGTDYQPIVIGMQVQELLHAIGVRDMADAVSIRPQRADVAVGVSGFTATPAGISRCLQGLAIAPGSRTLLVDRAMFQTADAGVIVVAGDADAQVLDIWVVGPTCQETNPDLILHKTQVLLSAD